MNVSSAIKSIIVPRFEELGFQLLTNGGGWTFVREKESYKDFIEISDSQWEKNCLRIFFYNSKSNTTSYRLLYNDKNNEWHYYNDNDSLRNTLDLFVEVTRNLALDWFSRNQPVKGNYFSNGGYLSNEEITYIADEFSRKYDMDLDNPERIITFIEQMLSTADANVKDEIMVLSYVYGEVFIRNVGGGEWAIEDNAPIIKNIIGKSKFKLRPFSIISKALSDRKYNGLFNYFQLKLQAAKELKKSMNT